MRTRVSERLSRAARAPVTLIVAPAGFGKTTALRDYLASARVDAVRYDVARDDATLLAFVRGLAAALAPVAPAALAAFPSVQTRVLAAASPVRELAEWFDEHLRRTVATVVVDDLHHAAADPRSVALLADVIERTHERIRWIVASRSDAGLPVASWLGYGRCDVPVGEADLRFSADEALAAASTGDEVPDAGEVEALRALTGGWPVALAIALRTRTHAADLRAAASGTREMVYRYLAEQVFSSLREDQREFLLASCVVPTFDAGLAEALGATPHGLAELRRDVTFLAGVSAAEYRYHDLFRDFLESELRARGGRALHAALVRAADALSARGDEGAALALLARSGDDGRIVALLRRAGFAIFERGESEVVAAAIEVLSDEVRRDDPHVLGLRAMLDASRGRFDVAQRGYVAAVSHAGEPRLRLALVHRYALELVRHDLDAVELLEPHVDDESVPDDVRVPMLGTLATAYARVQRIDEAATTIGRALDRSANLSDEARARLYQQAAYVHQFGPARDRARDFAAHAAEVALACNLFEVAARAYSVLYTIVADEVDDPLASLAVLDRLRACARAGASAQAAAFGLVATYGIEVERGDEPALERLAAELDAGRFAPAPARAEALLPAEAMRAAWSGDFARAFALLDGTAATQTSPERRALRAAEIALYAVASGAREAGDAALRAAADAFDDAPQAGRRRARAALTLALAELTRGRAPAARRWIVDAERALGPAMPRLRAFAAAVRAVERRALGETDAAPVAAAVERLRAEHFGGIARLIDALPFPATAEGGFGALTPAEREILALLARGASTKDVAAASGRSPQTVDTHIRSICRKLGCSGRREAVARAVGAGWVAVAG